MQTLLASWIMRAELEEMEKSYNDGGSDNKENEWQSVRAGMGGHCAKSSDCELQTRLDRSEIEADLEEEVPEAPNDRDSQPKGWLSLGKYVFW
ncbi:hypothetical protein NUU61_008465 [Penicillium alfredii]|uniref:Uncharacterized protein n=1 Tax=Penicillium alfredii TaxID=1506179 RepID=A0A9W9EL78_9EURO|nr:uncharacterized protein NUU61_008465 [Penicillium alfredii]KAJ5083886.1 hypothetical protein NUU61_008465 [Penicillium alfredii]